VPLRRDIFIIHSVSVAIAGWEGASMARNTYGIAVLFALCGFLTANISLLNAQPLDDSKIGEYSQAMVMGQLSWC